MHRELRRVLVPRKRPTAVGLPPDAAVIAALKEGHREFLRFVTRRAPTTADAEDILQDFLTVV
jgi:hypothetical protein